MYSWFQSQIRIQLPCCKCHNKIFPHCANGPYYKYYYVPGYLYWPPIRYRSCDGLICSHPGRCAATSSHVAHRWAQLYLNAIITATLLEFISFDMLNTLAASADSAHLMLTANIHKYATDIHTNVNVLLLAVVHMDMYGIEFNANVFSV